MPDDTTQPPQAPQQRPAQAGFDERLAALERIVHDLEEGGLGLEQAIERYQEGIELLKTCHATLAATRKRVEELTEGAEGVLRPLADDPDFALDREHGRE